jgi:hypothetical protein
VISVGILLRIIMCQVCLRALYLSIRLPPSDPVTERLTPTRLPFMQIRSLRCYGSSKKTIGQVINVPCDVDNVVKQLPRQLDDDLAINVDIQRKFTQVPTLNSCRYSLQDQVAVVNHSH